MSGRMSSGRGAKRTKGEGFVMDRILKSGDPCPCCGQPILTNDPDKLLLLSWLAGQIGRGSES